MDESNQGRSGGSSNRNRSRNNNRNRNHSGGGGQGGGGGNRNRNRNRNRSRKKRPAPTPPTLGEKLLYFISFGKAGRKDASTYPKSEGGGKYKAPNTDRYGRERDDNPAAREERKPSDSSGGGGRGRRERSDRPQRSAREDKPDGESKPKRAPRTVEVTSGRLYVGNLVYEANETDLEDLFRGIGNVTSTEIVVNSRTQQSKGFAFVEMGSIEEAKRAVEILHDKDFMGRKLLVTGAKSDGPRDGSEEEGERDEAEMRENMANNA